MNYRLLTLPFSLIFLASSLLAAPINKNLICSWNMLNKEQRLISGAKKAARDIFGFAELQKVESVTLPYKMTSSYKSTFLKLETKLDGVKNIYLSYLPTIIGGASQQVIPTYVMVESWHNIIRNVSGYQFSLSFATKAERLAFISKTEGSALLEVGYRSLANGSKEYLLLFKPEQFEGVLRKIGGTAANIGQHAGAKFVQVSKMELQMLSSSTGKTFGNSAASRTTYYFKNGESVGYSKDGKYFKLAKDKNDYINYASHMNILTRQSGKSAPLSPAAQFELGRGNLEKAFKEAGLKSLKEKNMSIFNHFAKEDGIEKTHQKLKLFSDMRIKKIKNNFKSGKGFLSAELKNINYDLSLLQKGAAESDYYIRFVMGNFYDVKGSFFVYSPGELLHDQMALAGLGKLAKDPEFSGKFIRGGLLKLSYGKDGELSVIRVVDDSIRLPSGNFKLSAKQITELESALLKQLNPKAAELPTLERIDLSQLKDAKIVYKDRKGYSEYSHLIKSKEHLIKETTFKRGFNVYKVKDSDEKFIVIANWQNPEKGSTHFNMWYSLESALGRVPNNKIYPDVEGLQLLQKGYLQPIAGGGGIEVYDLAGASMWASKNELSSTAQEIKSLFKDIIGYDIEFARGSGGH